MRIVPFVDIFFMCMWGEMNFMSLYSSAILESPELTLDKKLSKKCLMARQTISLSVKAFEERSGIFLFLTT